MKGRGIAIQSICTNASCNPGIRSWPVLTKGVPGLIGCRLCLPNVAAPFRQRNSHHPQIHRLLALAISATAARRPTIIELPAEITGWVRLWLCGCGLSIESWRAECFGSTIGERFGHVPNSDEW